MTSISVSYSSGACNLPRSSKVTPAKPHFAKRDKSSFVSFGVGFSAAVDGLAGAGAGSAAGVGCDGLDGANVDENELVLLELADVEDA
jgi:hypothetical protein